MAKILNTTALALFAMLFAANAQAQESALPNSCPVNDDQGREFGKPDRIVLESKTGSVMTSSGGEYQTAPVGKLLAIGDSMMLADQSQSRVVYYYLDDRGNVRRKCVECYVGANTYIIDDRCTPAAAWLAGGNPMMGAGIIIGAGLIGAAILNGMDEVPVGPLSTGPNGSIRHF